jgi:hypothetical protein
MYSEDWNPYKNTAVILSTLFADIINKPFLVKCVGTETHYENAREHTHSGTMKTGHYWNPRKITAVILSTLFADIINKPFLVKHLGTQTHYENAREHTHGGTMKTGRYWNPRKNTAVILSSLFADIIKNVGTETYTVVQKLTQLTGCKVTETHTLTQYATERHTFLLKHATAGCKHEKADSRENGIQKPATRKPEALTVATLVLVSDRIEPECQSRSCFIVLHICWTLHNTSLWVSFHSQMLCISYVNYCSWQWTLDIAHVTP